MTHQPPPHLRATAINYLRAHIASGVTLQQFIQRHPSTLIPGAPPVTPAIWIYVGGSLYADPAGDKRIRLKPHQIGVVYCWRGGKNEHAIYDARQLWDDIINPKPVQLPLFPEFA